MPGFPTEAVDIAGLSVQGGTSAAVIDNILARLRQGIPTRIAFCNAHTLAVALNSPGYAEALCSFTVLNDGVGIDIAAGLLHGRRFPENLNGTDLIPELLRLAPGSRIFLLGARPEVIAKAEAAIQASFAQHEVVGSHHGFFEPSQSNLVLDRINGVQPDILMVGMGNPTQELFVAEHAGALSAKLTICCGALFDFMTGQVARAPPWIRHLRLEWVYRLAQEPRRLFWRYTVEPAGLAVRLIRLRLRTGPTNARRVPEAGMAPAAAAASTTPAVKTDPELPAVPEREPVLSTGS